MSAQAEVIKQIYKDKVIDRRKVACEWLMCQTCNRRNTSYRSLNPAASKP